MRASGFPGFKKPKTATNSPAVPRISIKNNGLDLIDDHENDDDLYDTEKVLTVEAITAPLISHDAAAEAQEGSLPQYGVFGQVLRTNAKGFPYKPDDKRLYCNINAPFTAVVCGVQGSGKSHTVSVLLESMLIQDPRLGVLPSALSGLVLHFGESGSTLKPCEATFVGQCESPLVEPPEVVVFCSPSNRRQVSQSYAQFGGSAKVYPLYFLEEDVDATSLLSLMAVSESGQMPLYMHMVMQVLSDLGQDYTYTNFKMRLGTLQLEPIQARMLNQRLSLLEGFLCRKSGNRLVAVKSPHPEVRQPREGRFKQGQLTIVDLTDPFISPSSACSLFEIVLKLFNKAELKCSKVVVLDEAHKYLSAEGSAASEGSKRLTDRLLTFTRQQRHLAMRVIISTQEPTVVPSSLLDLCSFIVCHRFFSAGWFGHLAKHVSTELDAEAFERVVMLDRGECLIFSPTSLFVTAPEEVESQSEGAWGKTQGKGTWGATTKGDWAEPSDTSPNNDSGWGSGPVAPAESTSGHEDGGSGNFFAKKLPKLPLDPTGTIAPSSGPNDVASKKDSVKSKDSDDDGDSDKGSAGDDDIDIIIRDSDSAAEGVDRLTLDSTADQGQERVSLSGWVTAATRVKVHEKEVGQLGRGYIVAKTRRRITDDGGRSILATDQ